MTFNVSYIVNDVNTKPKGRIGDYYGEEREVGSLLPIFNIKKHWEVSESEGFRRLKVADGRIYVGTTDGSVIVYDQSGDEESKLLLHSGSVSSVDISSNMNIVSGGFHDQKVVYSQSDGTVLWEYDGNNSGVNVVAFSNKGVLSGNNDGEVKLLNANSGEEIWQFAGNGGGIIDIAHFGIYAYAVDNKAYLYKINMDDGSLEWQHKFSDSRCDSVFFDDDSKSLFVSGSTSLYKMNSSGDVLGSVVTGIAREVCADDEYIHLINKTSSTTRGFYYRIDKDVNILYRKQLTTESIAGHSPRGISVDHENIYITLEHGRLFSFSRNLQMDGYEIE